MKLDRNINPDGKGKYALINLRTNQVQWGGDGGEQFFVIKYKDRFAAPALRAYAKAARDHANELFEGCGMAAQEGDGRAGGQQFRQAESLIEFADEMDREADAAEKCGEKIPD